MLDQINNMTHDEFVTAFGGAFEDSPWVASRAWKHRPFRNLDHLSETMNQQVANATHAEQLALIRAHPDLGTRAQVSPDSAIEQAGAGLDRLTVEEYQNLLELNTAYLEQFRHPFILAVKGTDKHLIMKVLERRLHLSPEEEFAECLRQIERIARFRLEQRH